MKDVLIMTQAYELLYNIEVILRQTINEKMRTGYGIAWEHRIKEKHSFANCYYHELIPYFAKYSPLQKIFTEKERKQLIN